MKNTIAFMALAIATAFLFTGCNKGSDTSNTTINTTANSTISTSDVTQAVTNAVSASASGMVTQSQTTAQIAATPNVPCGGTKDTVISYSTPAGSFISFNYNLNFSRTCTCSGGTPSQYTTNVSGTSGYSLLLMSSTDTTSAQFTVTGVQSSAADYVLNGTYTRTGTITSFISSQHTFSSTIDITSTNVTVAKSNSQIVSGSATAQFSGTDANGKSVSHTASITFLGNNQATLVVDNGTPSTIQW